MDYTEQETIINNKYDYSNIVPIASNISQLVRYCENVYTEFKKLTEADEAKNEKVKTEYRNYNYGKCYGDEFEVVIYDEHISDVRCSSLQAFEEANRNGHLNNVNSLDIKLTLKFKRGGYGKTNTHENAFKISFKPYNIKFERKSNYNDTIMDNIESTINEILNKMPKVNTIFCTK